MESIAKNSILNFLGLASKNGVKDAHRLLLTLRNRNRISEKYIYI